MQALDRLIAILEFVAAREGPAGPAEVAQEMGLPLSTVARLMRQLADAGLLYRSGEDGRYALGSRIFALAGAGIAHVGIAETALPTMRRLRDESGETVSLHVLRGSQRVCVAEVQSHHSVRRVVPPGMAQDLVGTATGEVLLADLPAAERNELLEGAGLSKAARKRLAGRLEEIRDLGYAIRDDFAADLTGLSVPVRQGGRTAAALTISGPTVRFDREVAERLAPRVLDSVPDLTRPA